MTFNSCFSCAADGLKYSSTQGPAGLVWDTLVLRCDPRGSGSEVRTHFGPRLALYVHESEYMFACMQLLVHGFQPPGCALAARPRWGGKLPWESGAE